MARLYIFDTLNHIFRAFHALPATLTAPDGRPTNALYGILGIMRSLWRTQHVEHFVAVFESLEPTFRSTLDPEYKAHRPPTAPELKAQIPLAMELFEVLGIPTLGVEGFEADDVMGTLAARSRAEGHGATLVSNDKDLAQVLAGGGEVDLLRLSGTGKNAKVEKIGPDEVCGVFGVPPELIPSWLALRGDPVDNIRGIAGIGQKTAVKLLLDGGDLPTLLDHPELCGKFAPALRENRERLLRDLEIATVRLDVPLPFEGLPIDRFQPRPVAPEAAEHLRELGMKTLLKGLEETLFPDPTLLDLWGD
ncbi:MAG: 5'-3' exonuclease [Candidatus Xenobium sp.]|nr:hypothetical protein [Burkholderiales bacterium]